MEGGALSAEGLVKDFGGLRALDGLTLSVSRGEIYGLVGPDGAGKTTALRILASLMEPTAGRAAVNGFDVVREEGRVKESIGYMSQRFGLYPDLTVTENLRFYADIYGVPRAEREESTDRLLKASRLDPFGDRRAGNLSGGMKQKLALSCAIIHKPSVLLLDEPTNGVDPVSRRDFWRILHALPRQGVAILVATSYLDEAERCGRVGLLNKGRLLAEGTPSSIKGMFPGTLLEVTLADARRAARLFRKELVDASVDLYGGRVRVGTREPEGTRGRVTELCRAEGIDLIRIEAVTPSLEDAFLALVASASEGVAS